METNQNILLLLDKRIEEIARAVFLECDGNGKASAQPSDAPAKLRDQLANQGERARNGKRSRLVIPHCR